jgi:neopullulanase
MDFPLQAALVDALKEEEGADFGKGMTKLYEALANDFVYADPQKILVFGDNHDMDRLFMQLNRDVVLLKWH